MPAFYRIIGFGFVAALILVAGAMIGAVLYETHISTAKPDDFWSRWQAIIGSFGVLAAIGVAIYTDVKVDRRFEAQIETQTELDRRADERQQAEWTARRKERNQDQLIAQTTFRTALFSELQASAHGLISTIFYIEAGINEVQFEVIKLRVNGISDIIAKSALQSLSELDVGTIDTLAKAYGSYMQSLDIFKVAINEFSPTADADLTELHEKAVTAAYWLGTKLLLFLLAEDSVTNEIEAYAKIGVEKLPQRLMEKYSR